MRGEEVISGWVLVGTRREDSEMPLSWARQWVGGQ